MATSTKIHLTTEDTGVFKYLPQTQEAADKVSELLQKNHDDYHIFFNASGFHNHIAHHLLTLYGLGAPASILEKHYKANASYQLPAIKLKPDNVADIKNPKHYKDYLGKGVRYRDWLEFFRGEIDEKGVEGVMKEYLFAGTEKSDDMLVRMFAGFLHPIIQLGFGIEFNQPAIVAEAFAEAAVHADWIKDFYLPAEQAARTSSNPSNKTILELLNEIRADELLSNAARLSDSNLIRDGILVRSPEAAIKYASQYTVPATEEGIAAKTAEMIATAVLFTAGAQKPPKIVKFDFYFMHCVNSSIFWTSFNKLPYLTLENKARLLEWKGRTDLVMYASRHTPAILEDEIKDYIPAGRGKANEWPGLFQRLFEMDGDDGHAVKLGRAVAHAAEGCKGYEGEEWAKLKGGDWLKVENMVVDSVEDSGETWARSVGFDEAWEQYPDREERSRL